MLGRFTLFAPHEETGLRPASRERIQRSLMRAFVEKFRQRLFLGTANVHRLAINDLSNIRALIVHVADQNRLSRTDDDAGGLQSDIDAVRTEVTFLSRVIFGIDKNGVIGTGGHAGFAADADRFIKVYNAIGALKHRGGWAGGYARRVRALIAASNLVGATHHGKDTHVNVLNVSPGDADRHDIFGLARGRAGMATDAASVVDDLRPLDTILTS